MDDYGIFHVFNKSIEGFRIFNDDNEYKRMLRTIQYYRTDKEVKLSRYLEIQDNQKEYKDKVNCDQTKEKYVDIIAYCLMPTHVHLILRQLSESSISRYMSNVLNSYAKYFNIKKNRKGPLWVGRYKKVPVGTYDHIIHLTRYVHLNPVTAFLIDSPEKWKYSSYNEYLSVDENRFCKYDDIVDLSSNEYKGFVEDHIGYQRELASIKGCILE